MGTTRRNELGTRVKNVFKWKQGKRSMCKRFNNISGFAKKIVSKQKSQICTVPDIKSMSSKKLLPRHFYILWRKKLKWSRKYERVLHLHQWILPCMCWLPNLLVMQELTLHCFEHPVHDCPCNLKGAWCHVVFQGGFAPSVYVQVHSTVYFLSLGTILCITPHSFMLLLYVIAIISVYQCQTSVNIGAGEDLNSFEDRD